MLVTDRNQYQLSTLSHLINAKATEYQELPDWPEVAPDPSVRNVEVIVPSVSKKSTKKETSKIKSFYSESESGSEGKIHKLEDRVYGSGGKINGSEGKINGLESKVHESKSNNHGSKNKINGSKSNSHGLENKIN